MITSTGRCCCAVLGNALTTREVVRSSTCLQPSPRTQAEKIRSRLFLAAALIAWSIGSVWAAEESEYVTDIVFALDISNSMQADDNFGKVRDRLIEFIRDEIDLDTNVAVITFGEDARLVARQTIKGDAEKKALIARLQEMKANSAATYMAAGIDLALQELRALRKQHPDRTGMLVMLTDGKNQPPNNVPLEQRWTFEKLRAKYAGVAEFQPGKDWFFWYCFIGDPDAETGEFAKQFQGESKPVTGPWKFLKVRFNRGLLKLPDVLPGSWTVEYPTAADRELGDKLTITTRNPGEYDLQISNIVLESGQRITVAPRSIRMNKPEQSVVLQLAAQDITPGEHRGRIIFRAPGKMVFVQPPQLNVVFRAVSPQTPQVTVAPQAGIRFGQLLPGKTLEGTFDLIPNEAASRLSADKPVRIELPKDLPAGVSLSAEPAAPSLEKAGTIRLKLTAAADASLPPQGYRGSINFSGGKGLVFRPANVPVSFEGGQPKVDVVPAGTIDFGTVAPGGRSVRQLVLVPNEAAAALGTRVSIATTGELPSGSQLDMEPASVTVKSNTVVRLTLRLADGATATGDLQGRLGLSADKTVELATPQLSWQAKTARAVIDVTPGDRLDFASLEVGRSATQSFWLTPNEAAAARKPKVKLSTESLPVGATVSIVPQDVTLEKKREIKVTVTAGTELGRHEIPLRLAGEPSDVHLGVAELALVYSGQEGGITFDTKQLVYSDLLPGDSMPRLATRVVASPGAFGKTVRLSWDLAGLPQGMTVTPNVEQVTVTQAEQEVSFGLTLKNAVAGEYSGKVLLAADGVAVRPAKLAVRIVVAEPLVEIDGVPEPWLITLGPFSATGAFELPLTLRANRAATSAIVSIRANEQTPAGIQLSAQPERAELADGKGSVRIGLTAGLRPGLRAQTYTGQIALRSDDRQTVVRPAAVTWKVVVRPLWPYVLAGLALIGLVIKWRWPDRLATLSTLKLEEKRADVKVFFVGREQAVPDSLDIGRLRKYSVYLGCGSAAPEPEWAATGPSLADPQRGERKPARKAAKKTKKARMPDLVIQGDPAVRPQHARIFRRRRRHYVQAYQSLTIEGDCHRSVSRGRSERLYDGDKLRLGSVVFEFSLPGSPRRTTTRN